jgi:hypothetical protein
MHDNFTQEGTMTTDALLTVSGALFGMILMGLIV